MIFVSTYVGKVGAFSFRKSFYIEGRIMSKADKLVLLEKKYVVQVLIYHLLLVKIKNY